jgi:hypothetical protein
LPEKLFCEIVVFEGELAQTESKGLIAAHGE